jgi:hypothetical protein
MVLVSIHPFAVRRLFLVVLALAGFSALCFADPVLMARRYNPERLSVAEPPSRSALPLNLTVATEQDHAWNAMIALEKGHNLDLGASFLFFGMRAWDVRPATQTAITLLSPEPTATN